MEKIEIVYRPDGTTKITVITSQRDCQEVTRPYEDAKGAVLSREPLHNPGQEVGGKIQGTA